MQSSQRDREVKNARTTLDRVSKQFLDERKAAMRLEGKVEKNDFHEKDLLSLLVRANMANDVPENARMTDEEVLARTHHLPSLILYLTRRLHCRGSDLPSRWPRDDGYSRNLDNLRPLAQP
jgi:hypothetical protein